jgi:hypothetical protein
MEPVNYTRLSMQERRVIRLEYVIAQDNKCAHCNMPLDEPAAAEITAKSINWDLFPGGVHFLDYPVHLDHNHDTGMTRGAVHAYCNAVMWQYYGM